MKSYTDLGQSRKLAEILSFDSADMSWVSCDDGRQKYYQAENRKIILMYEKKHWIPCWSLVALLGVLSHPRCFQGDKPTYWFCGCFGKDGFYHEQEAGNPIDACYEMILELHELNLL